MPTPEPLNADEELVWRALMRVCISLPRGLDTDLVRASGLSLTEYTVLVRLSETPGRQLRIAQLATHVGLSPSRMSRVVDALQTRGLVLKQASIEDGRGSVAVLTDAGMKKLRREWPAHLDSVRVRAFDHINPRDLKAMGRGLRAIAERLGTED
jgi:DNA-binding MarR family transcriptional regulator